MVIAFVITITNTYGQTESIIIESHDSIDLVKDLEEIVISAPEISSIGDRTVYYPTKELADNSNSSIQLLAGLQIPELVVNPATGDISLYGNSKLSIRLNGRPATQQDLASISSKDVVKVNYISNPGASYGNADAVIDIIIRHRETGYGVMLNVLQSPNRGWGNYTGAVKYNIGKSEFTLDYSSNPMWDMDCYRNNTERIVLENGSIVNRVEDGIKTPNRMVTHHGSIQYSYTNGNRIFFNVQARMARRNDRYVSSGYITTTINSETYYGKEREEAPMKTLQGDLDIYFHYKLNKKHKIYFNIVPTILSGTSDRVYESPEVSVFSNISNHAYHILTEGIWDGRFGNVTMTAGVRNLIGNTSAKYDEIKEKVDEKDDKVTVFSEWKQSLNQFQYAIGIEGVYYTLRQPTHYSGFYLNPRLSVRYKPYSWGAIYVKITSNAVFPSVNQLNPEEQRIDNYQWSKGNMDLKPFQRYDFRLGLDLQFNNIFAQFILCDRYSHDPIMGYKKYIDKAIVNTYLNGGYNNNFEIRGLLRMPVFTSRLTLSLEGGWHKIVCKGKDYRHNYSQPFVNAQLMYMIKNWWVMVKYNTTYNDLWGETLASTNQNLLNLGVGYTYRNATFMAGIVNPFGYVALRTRDFSNIAGYDRTYLATSSGKLFWLGISMNLHKGKKHIATKRKIENTNIYETINNQMK